MLKSISHLYESGTTNRHHLLAPTLGGHQSNKENLCRISIAAHDAYNRVTNGGNIPSIRFITHHLIRTIEHAPRIIQPDAIEAILSTCTPMDWRDCYLPQALAPNTIASKYVGNTFEIAQNWLNVLSHEDFMVRRAIGGILHSKLGYSKNTALMNTMNFFETDQPLEAINTFVKCDGFCSNMQKSVREKITSVIRTEKPKNRTKRTETQIARVLGAHLRKLKAVGNIWYPIDKYEVCLDQAIEDAWQR